MNEELKNQILLSYTPIRLYNEYYKKIIYIDINDPQSTNNIIQFVSEVTELTQTERGKYE